MERYEAYKDSGIEWIGEIPEHWKTLRLKDAFSVVAGATPKSDVEEYWGGDIPWITPADYSDGQHYVSEGSRFVTLKGVESCATRLVPAGSAVVSNRAPIGLVSIASNELCTNQGCKSLVKRSEEFSSEFVYWFLSVQGETLNSFGKGTTFLELSTAALEGFEFSAAPLYEQEAISDYLDAKTAEVDALIADCEREVELLQEYRKAVISEAVTKGLDPDVSMKDSGVEWIGEIPEGWLVAPLKHIVVSIESGTSLDGASWPASESEKGVLTLSAVYQSRFDATQNKAVSPELYERLSCLLRSGALLISRCNTSEWVGTAAYVSDAPDNLFLPDKLWQLTFASDFVCRFIQYALQANAARNYFAALSVGASSTMQNIAKADLLATPIAIPNNDEALEIVAYLDAKTAEIDSLVADKQAMAEKLREYRKSLISECVTGKFKVPGI